MTPDYTVDELMVAALSRQLESADQVCNGAASFIPVCAFSLARATHAPDLVWLAGAVGLDAQPRRSPPPRWKPPCGTGRRCTCRSSRTSGPMR